MGTLLDIYFTHYQTLYQDIETVLDNLPPEAIDWSPGPDINSVGVLVAHIVGSNRYWLGEVILNDPAHRDRPAEFETCAVTAAELKARLKDSLAYIEASLAKLTLDDLTTERYASSREDKFSVAWVLNHTLTHVASHVGHIQLVQQWWAQR